MTTGDKIKKWEAELERLHSGSRWGEARRFAGRSAGIRLDRINWLYDHISTAHTREVTP